MSEQVDLTGYHDGICTGDVQVGYSSNGTEQVAIGIQLKGGPGDGFTVTSVLYFTADAKDMSIEKLKACGWSGKGMLDAQIKGHPVRVGISYDEYQGKVTMKVNIVDGNRGFKMKNLMTDSAKSDFFARLEAEASAPPKEEQKGYPADWDKPKEGPPVAAAGGRKGFSLRGG